MKKVLVLCSSVFVVLLFTATSATAQSTKTELKKAPVSKTTTKTVKVVKTTKSKKSVAPKKLKRVKVSTTAQPATIGKEKQVKIKQVNKVAVKKKD